MMNVYKQKLVAVMMTVALCISGLALARCQSCAEKMAIKQSIKDAIAASLAKPIAKEKELDAEIEKCGCSKPKPPVRDNERAHHGSSVDSSNGCATDVTCCMLSQQLQDLACANAACCKVIHRINDRLKEQGHDAKKCCHKIRDDIEDVEELVISVIDQTAECCSSTELLLVSLIDQEADCCSVIETRIGDLCGSAVDVPLPFSINDFVDESCLDIITWLKSIYALVANIYYCTCNIG